MHSILGATELHLPRSPERLVNTEGSLSDIISQSHGQPIDSHPNCDGPSDRNTHTFFYPMSKKPAKRTFKKKTKLDEDLERRRSLLEEDFDDEEDEALNQVLFWSRLRKALAVNKSSRGLEALDKLVLALLHDDSGAALTETVLLLPAPDDMEEGKALTHPLFLEIPEPKSPAKRPADQVITPSAKKQKTVAPKKQTPRFSFMLPSTTPAAIKTDLANIIQVASSQGKTPFRVAYPWRGQRCWYDPKVYPDLHLLDWRTYIRHRKVFYVCTIYAPSTKADGRRKHKLNAIIARNKFISYNIEEFGYFGFLERFENSAHDSLMWLGGKAAKHAANIPDSNGPPPEDHSEILANVRARYDRVLARALGPLQIDEDGYASIPELLEQAQLLDLSRDQPNRLSGRALACIKLDVASKPLSSPSWVVLVSSFTSASNDDDGSKTEDSDDGSKTEDSDDDGHKAASDDKNDDDEQSVSGLATISAPQSTGSPDGDKTQASMPVGPNTASSIQKTT
ncbi:unnamed protein product [Phytophthora fragariaefolia]|uniref:Unnamed protein product n=1 Tax=Phytophthora fragariaefolia TaxID=1490495 RepID=A0A9W7CYD1_9STRA|nr:unnamed protein product [Phytophthora fragariaefolia]